MLWANSPWHSSYFSIFQNIIFFNVHTLHFQTSLNHIINNGLMPFFFLLVTLEMKRELLVGTLNSPSKAILPFIAAIGGMVVPAAIYLSLNITHMVASKGWAIPTATDIAFSLAILMLLKSKIPIGLKIFLTALAIIDDLGAIIIIAIFYTHDLQISYLFLALLSLLMLIVFNWLNVTRYYPYFFVGFLVWLFTFKSGIHSTIAGVILGFCIPLKSSEQSYSPLIKLEHHLQPWILYGVLPLFAFANTGLNFANIGKSDLFNSVTLGIFLGLFIGKQLGIFAASWIAIKTKLASLPHAVNLRHLYGLSAICGIGFTMSLFMGDLSFAKYQTAFTNFVKLGVLSGSILSGVFGLIILSARTKRVI